MQDNPADSELFTTLLAMLSGLKLFKGFILYHCKTFFIASGFKWTPA